jgi:hypothetical protein
MSRKTFSRSAFAILCAGGAIVAAPAASFADSLSLPKGEACADFPVTFTLSGGNQSVRPGHGTGGNPSRVIAAGTGSNVTVINDDTQQAVSFQSNGAVTRTTTNSDGSQTVSATGHYIIILFSTDVGGPSTTLYTGQVTYTVSPTGVWEVLSHSGSALDLCAALS